MDDLVLAEQVGRVTVLTLNRPDKRNALSAALLAELSAKLAAADADQGVGAVVLTGAGDKAFCAGADLQGAGGGDGLLAMHAGRAAFADLLLQLHRQRTPLVGAAAGHALAGGLGLLLSCDFVIARRDAHYGTPEIKRGLFPMMVVAVLLRTLGRRATLALALGGEAIDGEDLARLGGCNQVLPAAEVMPAALRQAAQLAALPGGVLGLGRQAIAHAEDMVYAQQLEYLRGQLTLNTLAEDAAVGIAAFLGHTEPQWVGR